MRELKQSTNVHIVIGPLVDYTDGVTPITSVTVGNITAAKIVNGETRSAITLSATGDADNEFAHLGDGYYELDLTATDTGNLGQLTITLKDSDSFVPVWSDFAVVTANWWDSKYSTDKLQADVTQWAGTATTLDATTSLPDVHVDAIGSSTANATSLGTAIDTTNHVVAANAARLSGSASAADNLEAALAGLSSGNLLQVDVQRIDDDADNATRFGLILDTMVTHTVTDSGHSPTTTAFKLASGASPSAVDDQYVGRFFIFQSGANKDVVTECTDYDGTTKVVTCTTLPAAPSSGDVVQLV